MYLLKYEHKSTQRKLNFSSKKVIFLKHRKIILNLFRRIDDLDLLIYEFDAFGKNFPKSQKISPDAFVQIAMQLAFYK